MRMTLHSTAFPPTYIQSPVVLLELSRFHGAIIAGSFVKRARYEPIRLIEKPKGMLRSNQVAGAMSAKCGGRARRRCYARPSRWHQRGAEFFGIRNTSWRKRRNRSNAKTPDDDAERLLTNTVGTCSHRSFPVFRLDSYDILVSLSQSGHDCFAFAISTFPLPAIGKDLPRAITTRNHPPAPAQSPRIVKQN